ncbi:MAG: hypothetical protein DI539_10300 [Flavobacterium psychrophilum]|nr:MAG: hypothetical protein DI539_10300 [Flavobacterium psychrophilum]
MKIKVGFLVSYDYEFLKTSLPLVYKEADTITLAIDENLNTWSGQKFTIAPEFFSWFEAIDTDKKITFYRDNFYIPELDAKANDTRERRLLGEKMGEGWNIQIDADEYFVDFAAFANYLKTNKFIQNKTVQICALWITFFKQLEDGILYIKEPDPFYIGSSNPDYIRCRKNKKQMKVYVPFLVLHQSWARTEEDLEKKLKNWGHNQDFDVDAYIDFWKNLSKDNYHTAKNFHPLGSDNWDSLSYCQGSNMQEIMQNLKHNLPKINWTRLFWKNLGERIKYFKFI